MGLIKSFKGISPQIAEGVFVAENATLTGDIEIGAGSSVWFQAVLRGDVMPIRIGERTNIQDAAIIHSSTDRTACVIGNDVTVGHRAILHGCTVHDEALIGMGAIVLDEAVVPTHTIVAAGALVPEGMVLESGFIYAGIPARKLKPLSEAQIRSIREGAAHYVESGELYLM